MRNNIPARGLATFIRFGIVDKRRATKGQPVMQQQMMHIIVMDPV